MPNRRDFLRSVAVSSGGLFLPGAARGDDSPVTGAADPRLAPFDRLMSAFLAEHKVPGAVLAVTRGGKLVHARGYGFADVEKKRPVQPASLFRIASISKPLTAVGVLQLVDQRKVKLDDPVLKYVSLEPHLENGCEPDPRWKLITVRHCLQHTGGWDRQKSFDPIGVPQKIADALGTKPPVPHDDVIRYMMGRKLDFDPGERHEYSNLGYLLLGRVIETASGEKYDEYVRRRVLAPLGVIATQLGRALPENRAKGEVSYYDSKRATGVSLYPPRAGERVPFPDGAANFEGYEAHGGWIASAIDLVRFASALDDPKRCPILSAAAIAEIWKRPSGAAGFEDGKPKPVYYGLGWNVRPVGDTGRASTWHSGLISGTSTILVRRHDGLNWAVLFNTDRNPDGKVLSGIIDPLVHEAADEVKEWPMADQFGKYLGTKPGR
jgi:N-acyl-D-amino-acid deacylase